jgi:hypothetical protein
MVLAIGSVYSARKLPEDGIASGLRESRDVWETVYAHLYTIVRISCSFRSPRFPLTMRRV